MKNIMMVVGWVLVSFSSLAAHAYDEVSAPHGGETIRCYLRSGEKIFFLGDLRAPDASGCRQGVLSGPGQRGTFEHFPVERCGDQVKGSRFELSFAGAWTEMERFETGKECQFWAPIVRGPGRRGGH